MKKVFAALLSVALLVGCGTSSGSSGSGTAGGGDSGAVELEFWLAQGNNVMDLVNEEVENLTLHNPHIMLPLYSRKTM